MARIERAARDCPPAERGAMLRRWLAALHSLDAEDEAVAARLHEARSPPSEEATAEAKKRVMDAEEEKNIPDAPAAPAAEASSSPPGSPSDPDAEWADVQMPAHGRTVAPAIVAAADDRVSIDVVVDAANVASASVLRFRSERAKIASFGDKGDDDDGTDVFDFRDVLLRSRCLENLVASFVVEPAADDDETRSSGTPRRSNRPTKPPSKESTREYLRRSWRASPAPARLCATPRGRLRCSSGTTRSSRCSPRARGR